MKVKTDTRVQQFLIALPKADRARIGRTIFLFEDQGFLLDQRYLKKLTERLWELRPGRIRLLFGLADKEAIIVNAFAKKTQKTPLAELRLAERRLSEYL